MAVPGQVIPNDPAIERAVSVGERVFERVGCTRCHVPSLPLRKQSWVYSEPNPYNPPGNVRRADMRSIGILLFGTQLPQPRLKPVSKKSDVIEVPLYSDFRLHDISDPTDQSIEALDQNQPMWSAKFRRGNRRFLTTRLWGVANQPPYFHHGLFTTLRESVLAHHGEAESSRTEFVNLSAYERDSLIEFLKTLQVLPPGTKTLVVDERFLTKKWSKRQP